MSVPRSVRDPELPGKRPPNWAPGAACPRASCGCGSSSKNWGGDRNQPGGRSACCGLRLPSEGPQTHPAEMAKFKRSSPERPATGTERRTS